MKTTIEAELVDDPRLKGTKCFYCGVELDDGSIFCEDTLRKLFYCVSCLEENIEEIENIHQ